MKYLNTLFFFCLTIFMTFFHSFAMDENAKSNYGYILSLDKIKIRYGVWKCNKKKTKGTILLLNGRTEFMEKYAETIEELNFKGFDVYSIDWPGQGLSGRVLSNSHKGFVKSYQNYINDLKLFMDKIVKPNLVPPLIILAHSMGGHVALRFMHNFPEKIHKAVLVSPMVDISMTPCFRLFAKISTYIAVKTGFDKAYAIGQKNYSFDKKFEGNDVTSDPIRFLDEKNAIKQNHNLALGGVTYKWLDATFKSINILKKQGYANKIHIDTLIIGAKADTIVCLNSQKNICSLMYSCRYIEIYNARHEILKETDSVRAVFWKAFDNFIKN